jgi:hypothetical protein
LDSYDELPVGRIADETAIKEWRNALLTYSKAQFSQENYKIQDMYHDTSLAIDFLFVDCSFPSNISVYLDESNRFSTVYPNEHSIGIHQEYLLAFLDSDVFPIYNQIFFKCMILREAFCTAMDPICCRELKTCRNLLYMINRPTGEGSVARGPFIELLLEAYMLLKNSLSENPERQNDILENLKNLIQSLCDSQLKAYQFFTSIGAKTLNNLLENGPDNVLFLSYRSVAQMLGLISNDEMEVNPDLPWQTSLVGLNVPELIADAYCAWTTENNTVSIRQRFLEKIEQQLRSTIPATRKKIQECFQSVLRILYGKQKSDFLTSFSMEQHCLAFFDILNIADKFTRHLFKVNVQILVFLQQEEESGSDMEEGEEVDVVEMDDVTACAILYKRLISNTELPLKSYLLENSQLNYNNICVFPAAMVAPPSSPEEFKNLLTNLLGCWRYLAIILPVGVFQQCISKAAKDFLGTDSDYMLQYVFVGFQMEHYWSISGFLKPILAFLEKKVFPTFSTSIAPFKAYQRHFQSLEPIADVSELQCELKFLEMVTKEALLSIAIAEVPMPSGKSIKNPDALAYNFANSPKFPVMLVSFLGSCLASSPILLRNLFFQNLVEKIRNSQNSSAEVNEVLMISLLCLPDYGNALQDSAMRAIFTFSEDKLSIAVTEWKIEKFGFALPYIQDFVNSSTRNVINNGIIEAYVCFMKGADTKPIEKFVEAKVE